MCSFFPFTQSSPQVKSLPAFSAVNVVSRELLAPSKPLRNLGQVPWPVERTATLRRYRLRPALLKTKL